jgi:plastocyanin
MGPRRAAVALSALALVATACSDSPGGPKGPQSYTIDVDAPSPEGTNVELSTYFPLKLLVRPGDTVVFENRSSQAPHTVSFGVSTFAPEAFPVTKAGLVNPVVFGPCYTETLPPAGAEACPSPPPPSPPPFAGAGFWNSGILVPTVVPPGPPRNITLTVAPGTEPGNYRYVCLLHRNMAGALEVVDRDGDRVAPAEVAKQAEEERSRSAASAAALAPPSLPALGGATVTSGWGNAVAAVNRFSPAIATIKPGEKVTWKTASPYEPHTVTFASTFKTPEDPGVFTPGGVATGAPYTTGFAHSGLIGPPPFPGDTFSLVFPKRGTYPYVCVLHPGMAGQVEVT